MPLSEKFTELQKTEALLNRGHKTHTMPAWSTPTPAVSTEQGLFTLRQDQLMWQDPTTSQLLYVPTSVSSQPKQPLPPVEAFTRWGLDYVGPSPKSATGNKWLVTAIDYTTNWHIATALPSRSSSAVVLLLKSLVCERPGSHRHRQWRRVPRQRRSSTPPHVSFSTLRMARSNACTKISCEHCERWPHRRGRADRRSPYFLNFGIEPSMGPLQSIHQVAPIFGRPPSAAKVEASSLRRQQHVSRLEKYRQSSVQEAYERLQREATPAPCPNQAWRRRYFARPSKLHPSLTIPTTSGTSPAAARSSFRRSTASYCRTSTTPTTFASSLFPGAWSPFACQQAAGSS